MISSGCAIIDVFSIFCCKLISAVVWLLMCYVYVAVSNCDSNAIMSSGVPFVRDEMLKLLV